MLVLASDDSSKYYWHNTLDLSDSVAPKARLSGPTDGAKVRGGVTLSAEASDNVGVERVEFLVNGSVVGTDRDAPYSISWDSTGVGDGPATIAARAVDSAGNATTSTSRTVTVDSTAPETTIDSGPSGTVNDPSASFTFSSSESGSTFRCSLDGGALEDCSSPKSYTNLANGSHTFEVKSTDSAGNTDASPASRTWTVNVQQPAPNVHQPPPNVQQPPPKHKKHKKHKHGGKR